MTELRIVFSAVGSMIPPRNARPPAIRSRCPFGWILFGGRKGDPTANMRALLPLAPLSAVTSSTPCATVIMSPSSTTSIVLPASDQRRNIAAVGRRLRLIEADLRLRDPTQLVGVTT
jgi:hypothetical protein